MSQRNAKVKERRETLRSAALEYAERGIAVLPVHTVDRDGRCSCERPGCRSVGKHPSVKNGVSAATTDPAQIESWWKAKTLNIGVVPGSGGFVVFDYDPWKPDEAARIDALVAEHGPLPDTLVIHSGEHDGERGVHRWYRLPQGDFPTKWTVGGIEVKATGSYVLAPPSRHRSGVEYEIADGSFDEAAEAPAWMLPSPPPKPSTNGASSNGRAGRLGRRTRTALKDGLPEPDDGKPQRHVAVGIARDLVENLAPDEAAEKFRQIMLNPASSLRPGDPWTEQDAQKIIDSVKSTPAPQLVRRRHTHTDEGNANRFADTYAKEVRWVPEWRSWVFYDGTCWREDAEELATQRMLDVARAIPKEADQVDDDERKFVLRWAMSSLNAARVRAAIMLAKAHPTLIARPADFDTEPMLLNCRNGVVDLRTGELLPHSPEGMHHLQTACEYDPDTRCEEFERVLEEAFGHQYGLLDYVQKILGYALTGDVSEEKFFFFKGASGAGKGTILDSFRRMLGNYGRTIRYETLTKSSHGGGGSGASEDVARLDRARFVVASEFERNQALAEAFVNTLTGGDIIAARPLYKATFEFKPQLKLFLSANHDPKVSGSPESGIWRRLVVVPFDHPVPTKDTGLKKRLSAPEAMTGILAWAVEGCLRWQQEELGDPPVAARDAYDEYRSDADPYSRFIEETFEGQDGACITKDEAYTAYEAWAGFNGIRRPASKQALGKILKERGIKDGQREVTKPNGKRTSQRVWRDIKLKPLGARMLDASGRR